jgi:hypothetical protein
MAGDEHGSIRDRTRAAFQCWSNAKCCGSNTRAKRWSNALVKRAGQTRGGPGRRRRARLRPNWSGQWRSRGSGGGAAARGGCMLERRGAKQSERARRSNRGRTAVKAVESVKIVANIGVERDEIVGKPRRAAARAPPRTRARAPAPGPSRCRRRRPRPRSAPGAARRRRGAPPAVDRRSNFLIAWSDSVEIGQSVNISKK